MSAAMTGSQTVLSDLPRRHSGYRKWSFVRKVGDQRDVLVPPGIARITGRIELGKKGWHAEIVEMPQHRLIAQFSCTADLRNDGPRQMCVLPGRCTRQIPVPLKRSRDLAHRGSQQASHSGEPTDRGE